jgi:L-asparaginase II
MSTTSKIQMTEILVNVSRNRIATDNDRAKYLIVSTLSKMLSDISTTESEEFVRHFEKHIEAIDQKLGTPRLKKAVVPAQKFQIIED